MARKKPRIHLIKGDTLVKYKLQRHPQDGVVLEFTVHPHLQHWMQRLSEETRNAVGGDNDTMSLAENISQSGILETGMVPADDKGEQMWRVHLNSTLPASDRPALRLMNTPRKTLLSLAWMRFCVDHLDRRVKFPALGDTDIWSKAWDERASRNRFQICIELDHQIRNLRLRHVTLDPAAETVTHTIR
jgi:hypothetical protein